MANWIDGKIILKGEKKELRKVLNELLCIKPINDNYNLHENKKIYLGENTIIDDDNIEIKNDSTNAFWVKSRWGIDYSYFEELSKKFNITIIITSFYEGSYTVEIKKGIWMKEYEGIPRTLYGEKIKHLQKQKKLVCPERMF